jgi:hypothetical protein
LMLCMVALDLFLAACAMSFFGWSMNDMSSMVWLRWCVPLFLCCCAAVIGWSCSNVWDQLACVLLGSMGGCFGFDRLKLLYMF